MDQQFGDCVIDRSVCNWSYLVSPVAVLLQYVADVGGQKSRACSELLENASSLEGRGC